MGNRQRKYLMLSLLAVFFSVFGILIQNGAATTSISDGSDDVMEVDMDTMDVQYDQTFDAIDISSAARSGNTFTITVRASWPTPAASTSESYQCHVYLNPDGDMTTSTSSYVSIFVVCMNFGSGAEFTYMGIDESYNSIDVSGSVSGTTITLTITSGVTCTSSCDYFAFTGHTSADNTVVSYDYAPDQFSPYGGSSDDDDSSSDDSTSDKKKSDTGWVAPVVTVGVVGVVGAVAFANKALIAQKIQALKQKKMGPSDLKDFSRPSSNNNNQDNSNAAAWTGLAAGAAAVGVASGLSGAGSTTTTTQAGAQQPVNSQSSMTQQDIGSQSQLGQQPQSQQPFQTQTQQPFQTQTQQPFQSQPQSSFQSQPQSSFQSQPQGSSGFQAQPSIQPQAGMQAMQASTQQVQALQSVLSNSKMVFQQAQSVWNKIPDNIRANLKGKMQDMYLKVNKTAHLEKLSGSWVKARKFLRAGNVNEAMVECQKILSAAGNDPMFNVVTQDVNTIVQQIQGQVNPNEVARISVESQPPTLTDALIDDMKFSAAMAGLQVAGEAAMSMEGVANVVKQVNGIVDKTKAMLNAVLPLDMVAQIVALYDTFQGVKEFQQEKIYNQYATKILKARQQLAAGQSFLGQPALNSIIKELANKDYCADLVEEANMALQGK